jgi:phosphoribosylformylglycinamidine synthase
VQDQLLHFFRRPALSDYKQSVLLNEIKKYLSDIIDIESEYCFNIEIDSPLNSNEKETLRWLFSETFEPENFSDKSFLEYSENSLIIEVGPRMNFTSSWSTNAVSICHACGVKKIKRVERSRRYKFLFNQSLKIRNYKTEIYRLSDLFYDRMTECIYPEPLRTFKTGIKPESVKIVPLLEEGKSALIRINEEMGLGLDEWDIDYYYNLFVNELKRNPTDVECFDLSQSNSEHSRHWFFKGRLIIDGKVIPESLMDIVKEPYKRNPNNSLIAFKDNSSAIKGYDIKTILPEMPGTSTAFKKYKKRYHPLFTAETHNFPTGIAPFPGAETGIGGRIRDVHATGRGSLVIAGTAGYSVGNLFIPDYPFPWEHGSLIYPKNMASPLKIEIEASNGASDYGNKFGEPIIQGFTRSFGLRLPDGERWEWVKPIMFTGGIGQIDDIHIKKGKPEKGMAVVKVGGPAYRIGIGGGSASSVLAGEIREELNFNAVQRGDAEMEQKLNRVIRACVEMGENNPIVSIHDQGAGGNCNVVKEIIYPEGAKIDIRKVILGDETLSVLEIWGAEYQENDALLIRSDSINVFHALCKREKLPFSVIGYITGDGFIVLYDSLDNSTPVNLPLEKILGDMPQKEFHLQEITIKTQPLKFPKDITISDALDRVLRLLSVGSKRFLTNKVDRSVTGLIARQQCAGPLQLTVSDVAVVAQSHFGLTGAAISIGEQPIKGLINPQAMARLSVAEALTNIVWAKISSLEDIKCSANWMWAPKLPGEGARLYEAAVAMRDLMIDLGIAIDGGKDSLSMAAKVIHPDGEIEIVKSPPTLVISAYCTCPDITKVVTPDIKRPGESRILFIDLSKGKNRLGASALAHCYKQVGDDCPDVDDPEFLKNAFNAIQAMIDEELILSGHDRSDGGLITAILEMAFSGDCGMKIIFDSLLKKDMPFSEKDILPHLFSEELGLLVEYLPDKESRVCSILERYSVPFKIIAETLKEKRIKIDISINNSDAITIFDQDMKDLRALWEETSYQIDRLQANPDCVEEEKMAIYDRKGPEYKLSFEPEETPEIWIKRDTKPEVAIIREEGSNGDREMASAFYSAGFEPWDVMMTDILNGSINLDRFKGIAFVGGFSYADVLDSAKGWAGTIRLNKKLYEKFYKFYHRDDTFSLGVCNGCQLMALLGWVPWSEIEDIHQPRFIHNKSGRFESRFSTVKILKSPSIMLKGMEGSILGIWVAHGEGYAHFPEISLLEEVIKNELAPIRYVDDNGDITEKYPYNPNGSPLGITALCTPDGRHLAMMPHPERTFLKWQWPWMPESMKKLLKASPWLRLFQNARQWCDSK